MPSWRQLVEYQKITIFAAEQQQGTTAQRRRDRMLAAIDFMCGLHGDAEAAADVLDQQACPTLSKAQSF